MRRRPDPSQPLPSEITPAERYFNRRDVMSGLLAAGAVGMGPAAAAEAAAPARLKYSRNARLSLDEKPNSLDDITTYNNFYEFGTEKDAPARLSGKFRPRPWTVTVSGEAERTGTPWTLLYGGRTRASMAYLPELAAYRDRVQLRPQDEHGLLDLAAARDALAPGTHVYSCGPEPLLVAVELETARRAARS